MSYGSYKEETITLHNVAILNLTIKAVLCVGLNWDKELWIPRSVLATRTDRTLRRLKTMDMQIAAWYVKEAELHD